jgi:hypothetical protein
MLYQERAQPLQLRTIRYNDPGGMILQQPALSKCARDDMVIRRHSFPSELFFLEEYSSCLMLMILYAFSLRAWVTDIDFLPYLPLDDRYHLLLHLVSLLIFRHS